jgi:hypothetical protein
LSSVKHTSELQTHWTQEQASQAQSLIDAVTGGRDSVANLVNHDSASWANVHFVDLHVDHFIIH